MDTSIPRCGVCSQYVYISPFYCRRDNGLPLCGECAAETPQRDRLEEDKGSYSGPSLASCGIPDRKPGFDFGQKVAE